MGSIIQKISSKIQLRHIQGGQMLLGAFEKMNDITEENIA